MKKFIASVLASVTLFVVAPQRAAAGKKDHQDAFMPGDTPESEIAREVRHQLVLLPYYGVFDDLAFKVDGSTVTLLAAR